MIRPLKLRILYVSKSIANNYFIVQDYILFIYLILIEQSFTMSVIEVCCIITMVLAEGKLSLKQVQNFDREKNSFAADHYKPFKCQMSDMYETTRK